MTPVNEIKDTIASKLLSFFKSTSYASLLGPELQNTINFRIEVVFGVTSVFFAITQGIYWWRGQANGIGFAILVLFIAANAIHSEFKKKFPQHGRLIELHRLTVFNQTFAALAAVYVKGPLSPYFMIYVFNCAAVTPNWFQTERRSFRIGYQALNLINFVVVSHLFYPGTGALLQQIKVVAALLMIGGIGDLTFEVLKTALESRLELTHRLEKNFEAIQAKQNYLHGFLSHFQGVAFAKNMQGEYILCNPKVDELYGESVLGKRDREINSPSLFQRLSKEEMVQLEIGETVVTEETLFIEGRPLCFAMTHFYIRHDGIPFALCAVGVDITQQKAAAREHEQSKASMISASKMSALGEMAGGIAHEINNPLQVIHGKAMRIHDAAEQQTLQHAQAKVDSEKIMKMAERISKIIRSLRAFARNAFDTPFTPTPVQSILDETLELCRERFKNHGIEIRMLPFDRNLAIACRSVEICQVVLNLLNNAHDAVESLKNPWVELSIRDLAESIEFVIADSGLGIPIELQDKILQPFFTTKPAGKGTGLGLSISQGIVTAHGGQLTIENGTGHTCFVVRFPKHQSQTSTIAAAA